MHIRFVYKIIFEEYFPNTKLMDQKSFKAFDSYCQNVSKSVLLSLLSARNALPKSLCSYENLQGAQTNAL